MVLTRSISCALALFSVGALVAQQPAAPPAPASIPAAVPAPIDPPVEIPAVPAPVGSSAAIPGVYPAAPATPGAPAGLPATPGVPGAPGTVPPATNMPPGASRLNDFQGDPIDLVLRTLARQAGMNIVVSDQVATTGGTVNMRIADKSPRQAINVIVRSKGLIIDDEDGVLYVKTQAEKAKEPTESGSYTLSYAQAKDVLPLLQSQLQSGVAPQFDQRNNTLYYRENRSNLDKVTEFLKDIDRPTQQVMIESRLVEVNANPKQSYGINWAGVVGGATTPQTFSYAGSNVANSTFNTAGNAVNSITRTTSGDIATTGGTGLQPNTTTNNGGANGVAGTSTTTVTTNADNTLLATPNNLFGTTGNLLRNGSSLSAIANSVAGQFAILSIPQMSATLRLLNEDADAEFLANPRIVTANNLEAKIKITRSQPVPQLNFNEQTAQAVFSGFQDKEFGNTLTVTPSINKDGFVSLLVKPEISNKVGDSVFIFGGATVTSPIIDKRELNSNVLIKSGDTLAIGGLLQDEQLKKRTKIPVLGDIPILGYAFQEKLADRTKRNLLIFVTPTVIQQGYGTGLEDQVSGLTHSGEEYADPNGWRNNAKGAKRLVPTSNRSIAADIAKPGIPPQPKKVAAKRY